MNFNHILNWRLLRGSHDFPGPDGGTCINEAAIVAAGFPYKEVGSAADCPPCFSRPLATYLIGINDMLPNSERHRLMPFVMRLSGSADSADVEQRREEYICLETIRRVLPSALRAAGLDEHAISCEVATSLTDGMAAAADAARAAEAADAAEAARAARAARAAWAARAAEAARAAWAAAAADAALYTTVIAIAEEAFAIGKQADEIDVALIKKRMDAAKKLVAA